MVPPDIFEATFLAMSTSNVDTACDNVTIIDDDVLEDHQLLIIMSTWLQMLNKVVFKSNS